MTGESKYGRESWRLLKEAMDAAAAQCGSDLLPCPCSEEQPCLAGRYKRLKQKIEAHNRKRRNEMKPKATVTQGPMSAEEKSRIKIEALERDRTVLVGEKEMAMNIVREQDQEIELLKAANRSLLEKIAAQRDGLKAIQHGINSLANVAHYLNDFATPVPVARDEG